MSSQQTDVLEDKKSRNSSTFIPISNTMNQVNQWDNT